MPDVVVDKPARSAICRATFMPEVPCCKAQPKIHSSTSARSIPARSTAALTATAPKLAPRKLLKAPRYALPIGVLAVETITASLLFIILSRTNN